MKQLIDWSLVFAAMLCLSACASGSAGDSANNSDDHDQIESEGDAAPGDTTDYADPRALPDTSLYGATNLGVSFFSRLIDGELPAEIMWKTKAELGTDGSIESYAGRMMLNYFGDPTLSMYDCAQE